MSKNDALDTVLQKITDEKDWQTLLYLCHFCQCGSEIILDNLSDIGRVKAFNKAVRSKFKGIGDIFSDTTYSPDYDDILKEVAKSRKIQYIPQNALSIYDVERLEKYILIQEFQSGREYLDEESKKQIEADIVEEIKRLYDNDQITYEQYKKINSQIQTMGLSDMNIDEKVDNVLLYLIIKSLGMADKIINGFTDTLHSINPIWTCTLIAFNPFYPLNIIEMLKKHGCPKGTLVTFIAILRLKQRYDSMISEF